MRITLQCYTDEIILYMAPKPCCWCAHQLVVQMAPAFLTRPQRFSSYFQLLIPASCWYRPCKGSVMFQVTTIHRPDLNRGLSSNLCSWPQCCRCFENEPVNGSSQCLYLSQYSVSLPLESMKWSNTAAILYEIACTATSSRCTCILLLLQSTAYTWPFSDLEFYVGIASDLLTQWSVCFLKTINADSRGSSLM